MHPALHLGRVFFRMFRRDRQALIFSATFPLIFMVVLGFLRDRGPQPIEFSVTDHAANPASARLLKRLGANPLFAVTTGEEATLRERLVAGEETMVLIIPADFSGSASTELVVLVDAAQVRLADLILPALENALLEVERTVRGIEPLFVLRVEDVQARSQRYIDFLLPGILAFSLMQISIAGSGFNIVEYRRKGILKRLFVTPIGASDFIAALCLARLAWCLLQLTLLLVVAVFFLDVNVLGSYVSLYFVIILGTVIFLCLGFCVGSIAKTQQAVGAAGSLVIFPQLLLSGVFFPIVAMPEVVQSVARALPLSFVVDALRGISNDGLGLTEIAPALLGILVWIVVSFLLATRLFNWKAVVG